MKKQHLPVLIDEVLTWLAPKPGESYFDMTAGYGGHAEKVLEMTRNYKDTVLNDRDENAISVLRSQFAGTGTEIWQGDFYGSALSMIESGKTFDLILADFGVSSPQLDNAERGFSYMHDAPLDMRMDPEKCFDARKIVNDWNERRMAEVLVAYGELGDGQAKGVARAIVGARPIETTGQLAEVVQKKMGRAWTHPEAKVFQAIRRAVNDELSQIEKVLPLLPKLLNPGGRVAIISFHSLEDRLVKRYFAEASSYGEESELRVLTKKPVVAANMEIGNNPRARSAKLRVAERPRFLQKQKQ
jgi:16S rRNA (cytosine1402-N4)-methyltransferase